MVELTTLQCTIIGIIFVWSGFVRSSLGFGGAALSLPFLLLVHNDALIFLPLIAVHLVVFSTLTLLMSNRDQQESDNQTITAEPLVALRKVDWSYLKSALLIMIVPKLLGVFGLITLPNTLMSFIIFVIVSSYSISYIFNRPIVSQSKALDTVYLVMGAYISGTSLIGAPLLAAVFASHVQRAQLRNTLFMLWIILVVIKLSAFVLAGIDLQLEHNLWLLPCSALGHVIGLKFHDYLQQTDGV